MPTKEPTATLRVEGVSQWAGAGKTYAGGVNHDVNGHDKKLLAAVEAAQAAGVQVTLDGDYGDFPGHVEADKDSLGKLDEAQASGAWADGVGQMAPDGEVAA